GCDTLVTGGGRQSNHVRMTAAAANKLGLACTIVIGGGRPDRPSGNLLLDELMGADIVWAGDWSYYAVEAEITETCDRLRVARRRVSGRPRPLRRRLRRPHRRESRGAEAGGAPRRVDPRPRLHGESAGGVRYRLPRETDRRRLQGRFPSHRRHARAVRLDLRDMVPRRLTLALAVVATATASLVATRPASVRAASGKPMPVIGSA